MKIEFKKLEKFIFDSSYAVNGSIEEQKYGVVISELFPNSEKFWKTFIVPFTNRIDETITDFQKKIEPRKQVTDDLREIGSFHFGIFLHLVYAHAALKFKHPSYFENFYTHLGTICDCTEDFLIHLYFIINECTESRSDLLQNLSKEDFIKIAEEWYDSNYEILYDNYLSKAKSTRINIPNRLNVINEYYKKDVIHKKSLKEYVTFSQGIRSYRNTIVHNYSIAGFLDNKGNYFIPKKEVINNYRTWKKVYDFDHSQNNFELYFTNREQQMKEDLIQLQLKLQALWEKPINDMTALLLTEKNRKLLDKYKLEFSG